MISLFFGVTRVVIAKEVCWWMLVTGLALGQGKPRLLKLGSL